MDLNYTSEMEKGLAQSRHIGHEEYGRKLDKRIEVEKQREQEYKEAKKIAAEMDSQLPK
ncbi:hypothetical protein [Oceanobacillus massiliensis]|uniref:hypothetical protein n=1 Tax=Oceanobacillus massiliensis TaxID=1465765 RepID=UPI000288A344|nr:hypothetical protein [Oceanobacillus massiliensis]